MQLFFSLIFISLVYITLTAAQNNENTKKLFCTFNTSCVLVYLTNECKKKQLKNGLLKNVINRGHCGAGVRSDIDDITMFLATNIQIYRGYCKKLWVDQLLKFWYNRWLSINISKYRNNMNNFWTDKKWPTCCTNSYHHEYFDHRSFFSVSLLLRG